MTVLPIQSLILNMTHLKNYGLQFILQMGLNMEYESSIETNSIDLSIHSQAYTCSDGYQISSLSLM